MTFSTLKYILCFSYDNPYVIAGNGTVGLEIHEQVADFDAVVIPVGGGGLLAGVAVAIKELRPNVKIIVCILNYLKTTFQIYFQC